MCREYISVVLNCDIFGLFETVAAERHPHTEAVRSTVQTHLKKEKHILIFVFGQ